MADIRPLNEARRSFRAGRSAASNLRWAFILPVLSLELLSEALPQTDEAC